MKIRNAGRTDAHSEYRLILAMFFVFCFGIAAYGQAPTVTFSTLYSFTDKLDGSSPQGRVYLDKAGNVYGTATGGGLDSGRSGPCNRNGCGVVFRIDADGKETTVYRFQGGANGRNPVTNLIPDAQGNLFGTFSRGDDFTCNTSYGCGGIFKLGPGGAETTFYTFHGPDGATPFAGLIRDGEGNFYGTTTFGGTASCEAENQGCGAAFKIDKNGMEAVVHTFSGFPGDGSEPEHSLLRDQAGNLFGTTYNGGSDGYGVVFKISPSGVETILHNFHGSPDGANGSSSLVEDKAGNLYGTTAYGGTIDDGSSGGGTVFKIDPEGNETVLYSFPGSPGGLRPSGNLIQDQAGNLYGTTEGGGVLNIGTIFRLDPNGNLVTLHSFLTNDGIMPSGLVVRKGDGGGVEFYGETLIGGASGQGTVYKLTLTGVPGIDVE